MQRSQVNQLEGRQQPAKGVLGPSVISQPTGSGVVDQLGRSEEDPQFSGGSIGKLGLMSSSSDASAKFRSQREDSEANRKASRIVRSGSVGSGERVTRSQRAEHRIKQLR